MTFRKLSGKQRTIFRWPYSDEYRAIICDGAIRSGKTVCMITSFILWAMKLFSNMSFGICGKSVASAERNIIMPVQDIVDITHNFKINYIRSSHLLTVNGMGKTNFFYVFGGKDESSYQLIQGITLAGVLFDEVALMPRSFVDQAIARTLSVEGRKLWFNCNPESPNHWFLKEWIEGAEKHRTLHLHFLMTDNPILTAEQLQEAVATYSGVFYDRYIRGMWVNAEGLVYDMFTTANITDAEFQYKNSYYVSCDYGTQNPTVFLLWHKLLDGRWICEKEYHYDGRSEKKQKTDEEYANDMAAFLDGIATTIIVDPSAASFIAVLRQRGYTVLQAKNDVIDGIRFTGTLIKKQSLLFRSSCKETIKEFSAYRWDDKKQDDTVIKENDHCMDAMRYFAYTILNNQKIKAIHIPGR